MKLFKSDQYAQSYDDETRRLATPLGELEFHITVPQFSQLSKYRTKRYRHVSKSTELFEFNYPMCLIELLSVQIPPNSESGTASLTCLGLLIRAQVLAPVAMYTTGEVRGGTMSLDDVEQAVQAA